MTEGRARLAAPREGFKRSGIRVMNGRILPAQLWCDAPPSSLWDTGVRPSAGRPRLRGVDDQRGVVAEALLASGGLRCPDVYHRGSERSVAEDVVVLPELPGPNQVRISPWRVSQTQSNQPASHTRAKNSLPALLPRSVP